MGGTPNVSGAPRRGGCGCAGRDTGFESASRPRADWPATDGVSRNGGAGVVIVSVVRFNSLLPAEEVVERFRARADGYRNLPGLVQKIYLRFRETGEFGAVYLWESEAAYQRFRET